MGAQPSISRGDGGEPKRTTLTEYQASLLRRYVLSLIPWRQDDESAVDQGDHAICTLHSAARRQYGRAESA